MTTPADRGAADLQTAGMVARYREPLMRYFTRHGFGPPICEDLAHDTFLRLFALKGGPQIENPEAYLFQIAGSVLGDYVRKQKVRRTHAGMVERIYASWFVGESPEHVLEGKQTFERFQAALMELKPRVRDVFLLSRIEGLMYTQIAVRLGVSVRTVEDDMARAMKHFVKRLRDPQ